MSEFTVHNHGAGPCAAECPAVTKRWQHEAEFAAEETASWDAARGYGTSHSPDERTVPALLAGILDALVAIAERMPDTAPIPPSEGKG